MERGDAIARSWRLMQLLDSPTGRTLTELETALECSRRTVMRDLQGLQKAGIPIYDERDGKEKRWKFVEGFKNKGLPQNLWVVLACHLAASERRTGSSSLFRGLDGAK